MTQVPRTHAGIELGERGWAQGSLLDIPRADMSYLQLEDGSGDWVHSRAALGETDRLVVVSQACDVVRSPTTEPYVEVARAFWTTDRGLIRNAKRNSIRHFWIKRRVNPDGVEEGLIADTTFRIYVRKDSLRSLTPVDGFAEGDGHDRVRFRRWLGARYNRQPIPDHLVIAVQKPIVDGLAKLAADDLLWSILDAIDEILFFAEDDRSPYRVEMFFLRKAYETPSITETEEDRLGGWVAGQLKKMGKAELDRSVFTDLKSISAYDYAILYQLPLDAYSLPDITS